jgi:hypothetical protein
MGWALIIVLDFETNRRLSIRGDKPPLSDAGFERLITPPLSNHSFCSEGCSSGVSHRHMPNDSGPHFRPLAIAADHISRIRMISKRILLMRDDCRVTALHLSQPPRHFAEQGEILFIKRNNRRKHFQIGEIPKSPGSGVRRINVHWHVICNYGFTRSILVSTFRRALLGGRPENNSLSSPLSFASIIMRRRKGGKGMETSRKVKTRNAFTLGTNEWKEQMMKMKSYLSNGFLSMILIAMPCAAFIGCEDYTDETMSEEVEDAADDTMDNVEEGMEETADNTEDAVDEMTE